MAVMVAADVSTRYAASHTEGMAGARAVVTRREDLSNHTAFCTRWRVGGVNRLWPPQFESNAGSHRRRGGGGLAPNVGGIHVLSACAPWRV